MAPHTQYGTKIHIPLFINQIFELCQIREEFLLLSSINQIIRNMKAISKAQVIDLLSYIGKDGVDNTNYGVNEFIAPVKPNEWYGCEDFPAVMFCSRAYIAPFGLMRMISQIFLASASG